MYVRCAYLIAGMSINKKSYRNFTIGAENMAQQQTVNDCQKRVAKSNLGSNKILDFLQKDFILGEQTEISRYQCIL